MAWLRPNRCNAYGRLSNGELLGLRLERRGEGAAVLSQWSTPGGGGRADAELLGQGHAALGGDEDTVVIYGGELERAVVLDLSLPVLPPTELLRALQFELPRHVPLALDSVRWGYRWVGQAKPGQPGRLRLVMVPDAQWQAWLAAASGLPTGVDLILPAPAALDPLLQGRDAIFCDPQGVPTLAFTHGPEGERLAGFPPAKSRQAECFGGGETPLAMPHVDLGPLASLPPDKQRLFAPVLLLALYGLGRDWPRDRRTLPSLPGELAPRRNRLQKFTATVAVVWALVLMLALLGRWSYGNWQEAEASRSQETALRRRLGELTQAENQLKLVPVIHKQLNAELSHRQSMLELIGELSDALDDRLWATKVEFKTPDLVSLMLRTEADAAGLTQELKNSVYFTNLEEAKVRNSDGSVSYTINAKTVAVQQLPITPPPAPALPTPAEPAPSGGRRSTAPPPPPPPVTPIVPPAEPPPPAAPVPDPAALEQEFLPPPEPVPEPIEPIPAANPEPVPPVEAAEPAPEAVAEEVEEAH